MDHLLDEEVDPLLPQGSIRFTSCGEAMGLIDKVNVILGISEGVITDVEVFATTARGEKLARGCFNKLCKSFGISPRRPINDEKEVRWFVTDL